MNTGVDDAVNLAWKIAAMVSGWGGPNLLASYEIERRPIAFRNTGMAKELSRGMGKIAVDDGLLQAIPRPETCHAPPSAKQLELSREEFASIGIQLGARYDDLPIVALGWHGATGRQSACLPAKRLSRWPGAASVPS